MIDLNIDFKKNLRSIRPMHGVNNGPVSYGSTVDVTHLYKEAGIPSVRLHDPNWPHPREVDIYSIFPDFDKDPEDPASYDFDRTDTYIRSIMATGANIVYRLGVSIEHTEKKYYTHPPADFEKWARICIGIVKHYNHGWANGFDWGIRHWEIWNEVELGERMWSGTIEQYFELYKAAATAIKQLDPTLKVGGFASTMWVHEINLRFMEYCRQHHVPLDFFSWHSYADQPATIVALARVVRNMLDEYGFLEAESHLNEWNYFDGDWGRMRAPGGEYHREEVHEAQKGVKGASFVASVLMQLQDEKVDVANYYDGQPSAHFCGLFNYYGVPQKTFYAFKAFQLLHAAKNRVEVTRTSKTIELDCCAAMDQDNNQAVVLISNFDAEEREYTFSLNGLPSGRPYIGEVFRIDTRRNLERTETIIWPEEERQVTLHLNRHTVVLLKISPSDRWSQ